MLRVTLGEMELEDAFAVTLKGENSSLTLGGLLNRVFSESQDRQAEVLTLLDPKENPDLPEMYRALGQIFGEWRAGRCDLRFFVNWGGELGLEEPVRHPRAGRAGPQSRPGWALLDLVIEQRYRPLRYAVDKGYAGDRRSLLDWLQERTLLYLLRQDAYGVKAGPGEGRGAGLATIAERLAQQGLVRRNGETRRFVTTAQGQRLLADMAREADSHARRYGIFADVLFDPETGSSEFLSARGLDLRAQIFEAEELDPLRAVFLLLLSERTPQELTAEMGEGDLDEDFFDEFLRPLVDRDTVDQGDLEAVIEGGLAFVDELAEESRESARRSEILRRADAP